MIVEDEKMEYYNDNENPEVEVWRWILVVPWWRLIFEQKRQALDIQ
jgi:hypothetical protein